jgi:succinate-semialdehyde dehydrogenase / glutarate-semialdehyde dehydrogenase
MAYRSFDPYRQQIVAEYDSDSDRALDEKIGAVHLAFREWRLTSLEKRCELVSNLADVLIRERERFAGIAVREMGKPVSQAIAEVEKCAALCRYYASNAALFLSPSDRLSGARRSMVTYDPQGIILGVMPWNFPYWQVYRFVVPALLAGNCTLLKHASNVTGCALMIGESLERAGFPDSVFRVILPDHNQLGKIISRPEIRGVALTGSNEAGSVIASHAGRNIKKTVMELGGSDPLIVFPDADIGKAVEGAFTGRFLNNGQSCIAAKRFIVHDSLADQFLHLLLERVGNATVGDPMKSDVWFSTVVSAAAAKEIHNQVERSVAMGARLISGGGIDTGCPAFYKPAILTNIPDNSPLAVDEVFGPVASVLRFETTQEALSVANSTRFGLGASVWSADEEFALGFARNLDCGTVAINGFVRSDPAMPFGGVKDSGYGRELSEEAIREFVNIRSISVY